MGLGPAVGMEELLLWMGLTQSLAVERPGIAMPKTSIWPLIWETARKMGSVLDI